MAQVTERTIPKVNDNYPGFCCQGFDYIIRLIFPAREVEDTSIWGRCENPECPKYGEDVGPGDPYRGVSDYLLDDFEDVLEEKGMKVAAC